MIEIRGKIDKNDLAFFHRLIGAVPFAVEPCPTGKGDKINPHVTRFYWVKWGIKWITDIFHVKPVYYETLTGAWRPMEEIAYGFGNHWINLKPNWAEIANPRYIQWLMKRMELIKGSVNFPYKLPIPLFATTSTFYPNPNPESTSVDGAVEHLDFGELTWATIIAAAGTTPSSGDDQANIRVTGIWAGSTTDKWVILERAIFLFDTSSIPDTDTISAATLSFYGNNKSETFTSSITANVNVYSSAPASNTSVAAGDYDSLGSTAFSTAIAYASWNTAGYNDFALNASGLANITATGVSKFGTRNANYDVAASAPAWQADKSMIMVAASADTAGTTSDPKLVVTHAAAAAAGGKLFMLTGIGK